MVSLEKVLRENADFLGDVAKTTSEWILDLREENSREVISYHPLNEGHMLRPLLVSLTASTFLEPVSVETRKQLVAFAAAVELMHNASLLHDDLLDKEENRRGKPCLYKKYGFKQGLLAGNIFYIRSIELTTTFLGKDQTMDLLHSAVDMCEGEILQAKYENQQIPLAVYRKIIRAKTGALTALACRQAAVLMGADDKTAELFGELGESLGILYQLRDDKKDQDVLLGDGFSYEQQLGECNQKIMTILGTLSDTKQTSRFHEILAYFRKN